MAPRSTRVAASRQPRYLKSLSDLRPEDLRPCLAAGLPLHCEARLALNSTKWQRVCPNASRQTATAEPVVSYETSSVGTPRGTRGAGIEPGTPVNATTRIESNSRKRMANSPSRGVQIVRAYVST
jgi:hypothetical protein